MSVVGDVIHAPSLIDDVPQRVRVLLDPEEDGEGGAVVDVGGDAAAAPRLLRQVHDLLRGARTLDRRSGEGEDGIAAL